MELISPLFVEVIAVVAIAAGLAVGGWLLAGLYWMHSRKVEEELPKASLPSDLQEVVTGAPPAMTVFYVFMILSLVGYVLYIWLEGVSY